MQTYWAFLTLITSSSQNHFLFTISTDSHSNPMMDEWQDDCSPNHIKRRVWGSWAWNQGLDLPTTESAVSPMSDENPIVSDEKHGDQGVGHWPWAVGGRRPFAPVQANPTDCPLPRTDYALALHHEHECISFLTQLQW